MKILDPRAGGLVRASLPAVEAQRAAIVSAVAARLAAADRSRPPRWAERAATSLVDILIGQARKPAFGAGAVDLRSIRLELLRSDIDAAHHAAFAGSIAAILRDAAKSALAEPAAEAWAEEFRTLISRMRREEQEPIAIDRDFLRTVNLAAAG